MSFDLADLARAHLADANELSHEHGNPTWAKLIRDLMRVKQGWVRAEGSYAYDADDRAYLDVLGGFGVMNCGHNHPTIVRALTDVLQSGLPNMLQMDTPVLEGLLARELAARSPEPLSNVFFASSGSEAVEAAIKFARRATGRPTIVSADGGYHGLTMGALSIMGSDHWKKSFGPMVPCTRRVPFNDLGAVERALAGRDVAAVVLETIQGEGGVVLPNPEYLPQVRRLCTRAGTLLVLDEIQVGLGRTGRFYAFEHFGVVPDMVLLAKALSGGFVPVGAVVTSRAILDKVYDGLENAVIHDSTFGANNLAMAAGLATLRVLDEEKLLARAERLGRFLREELLRRAGSYEHIQDVRGLGLMVGVEFGRPTSAALRANWRVLHALDGMFGASVTLGLLQDQRVISSVASNDYDVLKLTPPLTSTERELREFLAAFDAQMDAAHRFAEPVVDLARRVSRAVLPRARGGTR